MNASHGLDDRAPHRLGCLRAEQARTSLCRHAVWAQLCEVVETLPQKPFPLRRRQVAMSAGDAGERQGHDPLRMLRREAGGDQGAE
jgi:hypothetical protein